MTLWQDAPPMDPATGLAPGQSWAIPADGPWQARLDRMGRAHVVGRALAGHAEHGPGYTDMGMWYDHSRVFGSAVKQNQQYRRPWHTFERACRAADLHERLVVAAKRNEAQAGQGGE